ncbi:MAG: hypothetical protein ACFCBU_08765 [Cyanophyceae cyanobacterium]
MQLCPRILAIAPSNRKFSDKFLKVHLKEQLNGKRFIEIGTGVLRSPLSLERG